MTPDLTTRQAYEAMLAFLHGYWKRTGSEELADLLSGFQLNDADDLPMDPAAWEDWLDAIAEVTGRRPG
jgi:hypothetical protein